MVISSLRTAAFRNLSDAVVETAAKNIFLVGENGQGKTNFLEALYFCSYASSFRGARDSDIAQTEKKDFSASITTANRPTENNVCGEVLVKFDKGKKSVFIDGKKAEDRKELLSIVPCVVFCHEDMEFVSGSPERCRWFFDQALSLYDSVYLDDLRSYRRVLKSRNSVLRDSRQGLNNSPEPLLDALDQQSALYGFSLMEKRDTAARLFSEVFAQLFEQVSGFTGMTVQYIPSWKVCNVDEAVALLRKRRAADLATGVSLCGPHRDRYVFTLDNREFAGNASTGQRRLLALLLRVAQARRYRETTGRNPVLLLDDVLLEMDGEKRRRFLAALPDYDQAFYTFLPEEPFRHYRTEDTLVYYVKQGRIETEKQ
ncbi:MAG: DNA replication and repair protein RecF [Treponema sp.]|nr:DNA replication and repair protein RecF [Treponema sp.]